MSQKYPKELGVYLEKNYRVKVEWLKDSLSITAESGDKILFLSDLATSLSEQSVSFSHFNTILSLDAYTSTPKKGKFKKVLVNDFETKDAVDESIFYNDVKNIQFNFPALQMGAMGVVNHKERMNDPYILHEHYFTAGVPVEKSVFSNTFPSLSRLATLNMGIPV